jgi:hypothetical protein
VNVCPYNSTYQSDKCDVTKGQKIKDLRVPRIELGSIGRCTAYRMATNYSTTKPHTLVVIKDFEKYLLHKSTVAEFLKYWLVMENYMHGEEEHLER